MFTAYTVSVVDDDESVRVAICGLLRSIGLATQAFSSPEEFLESGAMQTTDCIITDIHMPNMSGETLQKALIAKGSKIPLIVITAFPSDVLKQRVISYGASGFLIKPFDPDALIDCLSRVLEIDSN